MDIFYLQHNPVPKEKSLYVFDSNVWLPLLGLESEEISDRYSEFFSKVMKTPGCKILLCPIQLSEILNRLLRYHAKIAYDKKYSNVKGQKPNPSEFYKGEYRSSEDFKKKYATILDDIDQYSEGLKFCDIQTNDFATLTTFKGSALDFNDNYLYLLAKEYDATIITHDGDFHDLDIRVGTYNKKLYQAYKDSVKPIAAPKPQA